jgi:hypothetical protein
MKGWWKETDTNWSRYESFEQLSESYKGAILDGQHELEEGQIAV